jgi:hypothetical protein
MHKKVKNFLEQGKTLEALDAIIEMLSGYDEKELESNLTLSKSKYNRASRDKNAGKITYDVYNTTVVQIESNVLGILRDLIEEYNLEEVKAPILDDIYNDRSNIEHILKNRWENALTIFSNQPIVWVEPVLSETNNISENPNKNYDNRTNASELIENPESTIIQAPPQFGLTSLAHYLVLEAWRKGKNWIFIDSKLCKQNNIHKKAIQSANEMSLNPSKIECIILDSWSNFEHLGKKKLRNLCDEFSNTPIIVMNTIDDSKFLETTDDTVIDRQFKSMFLLALHRTQIRQVVSEYNRQRNIGENEVILSKVTSDLECLNIHRTPMNCLTLLKVSEKYFDESPVNRTKMLEMVLFVLFNLENLPTYRVQPDLKDCEYVLGRFCEKMIRSGNYIFSKTTFLTELESFCRDRLMDLEVDIVYDILFANNILIEQDGKMRFRSSFWIYYFGAQRMNHNSDFLSYILDSKKYVSFPEIIEFYTGIDRSKSDALETLLSDLKENREEVEIKIGISDDFNPLSHAKWHPTKEHVEKIREEINSSVQKSKLPQFIKDQHADNNYNQIKPYNQSIKSMLHEYSMVSLMQKIKATARALRNSDYVEPELKRRSIKEIQTSLNQVSNVLFALAPLLGVYGKAEFGGQSFDLASEFDGKDTITRINMVLQAIPTNIMSLFREDVFSSRMSTLFYESIKSEDNLMKKHLMALMIVYGRPRGWKKEIEDYVVSLKKDSFFLYDLVNNMRARYKFDFLDDTEKKHLEYLIKMGLAKNHFGDKKPGIDKIRSIKNEILPKRLED